MKHFCRICLKATTDLNFVAIKTHDFSQIRMQLAVCVPEMVVGLVKDPIICLFCMSALRSAYSFKNLCLSTEQHIQNYNLTVSHVKSIDIEDLLYNLQRGTKNSVCERNGDCKNTIKEAFGTVNTNLLFSNGNLNEVNEDITIIEEHTAIQEVESSYEGFEDNLFDDKSEDHTAEAKSISNERPILQTNIETPSCFVKLTRLADDIVRKHNRFICKICNFTTRTKYQLKKHKLVHEEKKYLSCASCNFHTVHRGALIRHVQTHTGKKPFACNVCTFRSLQKSSLHNHLQKIHTGEKPFACNVCNIRFAQKSSLQNHLRIHTGEKPFACNVCTYRCSLQSSLQKHLRIHTGEKPFACNVCTASE